MLFDESIRPQKYLDYINCEINFLFIHPRNKQCRCSGNTNVNIALLTLLVSGNGVMKSVVITCHFLSGGSIGCSNPKAS